VLEKDLVIYVQRFSRVKRRGNLRMKDGENGERAVSGDDGQIQAWICGVLI